MNNKKYYCIDCLKEISGHEHKRCRLCAGKIHSKRIEGKNNPNWLGKNIEIRCTYCNQLIKVNTQNFKNTKFFFCSIDHYGLWQKINSTKQNNHHWLGGKSFEPYSLEFDSSLKEQVRFRDNYKCKVCGCPQIENGRQLHIHHIDYNKKNNKLSNLVALCISCHAKTNGNRIYWMNYFNHIIEDLVNAIKS